MGGGSMGGGTRAVRVPRARQTFKSPESPRPWLPCPITEGVSANTTVYSVPLTFEIEILDPKATAAANAGQGGGA